MALTTWTQNILGNGSLPIGVKKYREDHLSRKYVFSEASEAKRTFMVDYDQLGPFLNDLIGYPVLVGVNIQRVIPDVFPGCNYFYAEAANVTPVGISNSDGSFTLARVETTYRPLEYRVRTDAEVATELDRFVTRKTIAKADYLQLGINSYKWVSRPTDQKPLAATPGIIAPSKTLEYTWHEVPCKPGIVGDNNAEYRCPVEDRIVDLLGKTNSILFDSIYQPGTMLLTAAEAELRLPKQPTGFYTWMVRYFFESKDNGVGVGAERAGVNYLYDPINSRWDLITTDGTSTGSRLYQKGDLNKLFQIS